MRMGTSVPPEDSEGEIKILQVMEDKVSDEGEEEPIYERVRIVHDIGPGTFLVIVFGMVWFWLFFVRGDPDLLDALIQRVMP